MGTGTIVAASIGMRIWLTLMIAVVGCAQPDDPGDQSLPPELDSFFHFNAVDAVNLRVSDDGTFRWTIYGCDFGASVEGTWTRSGDRLVLRSADDKPLYWMHGGTFRFEVDQVEIFAVDGQLTAIGKKGSTVAFEQTWSAGGVCTVCGGDLGPTGQCACDDPFNSVCS